MAFTSENGRTRTTLSEINMVPFIDIVLVLLIIFMVTAPVIQSGVEVNVPKTQFVKEVIGERMIVSIKKDETVYLQDKPINVAELAQKIREKNPKGVTPSVYVRADEASHTGALVKVLASLKQGGIDNISLVTEPIEGK